MQLLCNSHTKKTANLLLHGYHDDYDWVNNHNMTKEPDWLKSSEMKIVSIVASPSTLLSFLRSSHCCKSHNKSTTVMHTACLLQMNFTATARSPCTTLQIATCRKLPKSASTQAHTAATGVVSAHKYIARWCVAAMLCVLKPHAAQSAERLITTLATGITS